MPTYTHNDYYGYINRIQEKAISNPEWFWSESPDASEARQWLYNNGASSIVDDIYKNTPDDMKMKIPAKMLSSGVRESRVTDFQRENTNKVADTTFKVGLGIAGAPALIEGMALAPFATTGGILGGIGGSAIGSWLGGNVGNNVYSRGTSFDGIGSSISTNRNTGSQFGGILGGIAGGSIGGTYGSKLDTVVSNIKTAMQNPDVAQAMRDFRSGMFNRFSTRRAATRLWGFPARRKFTPMLEDEPVTYLDFGTKFDEIMDGEVPRFTMKTTSFGGNTSRGIGMGGKGAIKGVNLGGGELDKRLGGIAIKDLKSLMEAHPAGTAISGDAHYPTLGSQLINDFQNFKFGDFYRHLTTNTTEPIGGVFQYNGMSPDAMSMFYRMAKDNPDKWHISYGTAPAGEFNHLSMQGGKNYHIYDAQEAWKSGQLSLEDYIQTVNNWLKPLGGRPASIVDGKPYISQPFIVRNK